jgi:hypothetical protein
MTVREPVRVQLDPYDPLEKLPALAARLGVEPKMASMNTVLLITRDGRRYDLFDLINAVLDRCDAVAPQPKAEPKVGSDESSGPLGIC